MTTTMKLPRLGETMEEGKIVSWLKEPGESFTRGETILEVETDKTVVEFPALEDGVLAEILAEPGDTVAVGADICRFEGKGSATAETPSTSTKPAASAAPEPQIVPEPSPAAAATLSDAGTRTRATPVARKAARERNIDISDVPGSGRRGRVELADVGEPQTTISGMEGNQGNFSTAKGQLAWQAWGAVGAHPTILCLHGFGGDASVWSLVATRLARSGRRVVALDLPGHGRTTLEARKVDDMVDALLPTVQKEFAEGVELVGHSLGGAIAARLARKLGELASSVTLLAPAGLGHEIDAEFIAGLASGATGEAIAHLLRRVAQRPPLLSRAQLESISIALASNPSIKVIAKNLVASGGQAVDIVPDLAVLGSRVRVIWGLEDRIMPWRQATAAGSSVAVHFVRDAGHMPQWDQPQEIASILRDAGHSELH